MKSKTLTILLCASGVLLLIILAFLISVRSHSDKPEDSTKAPIVTTGATVERSSLADPPPAPKAVPNPDRVRQNLREGKTYVTHTKGTLHVRGEDKDWGVTTVVTINYSFEALIDRVIESNDGTTIVEVRHFRDVRSLKIDTRLEDLRLDLGEAGEPLLMTLAAFSPEAAIAVNALNGQSLKSVLSALRWTGASPETIAGLDKSAAKAFAKVESLNGKSVRITFTNGGGVQKVEVLKGEMTDAEKNYHFQSSLLSDALIIPDVEIKEGNRWSVDGSNFANLMDPGLLAQTSGEVVLERAPDHLVEGKLCRHLKTAGGRILLDGSTKREGRLGHFEPEGDLYFSTEDQVIIKARLRGKAKLEKFSKDHLLFEARMRQMPELDLIYTCRVTDTLKKR